MAKRRCFNVDLFYSDEYLSLSDGAKVLYLGFLLNSDDEGVVINHTTAMRIIGASKENLSELTKEGLLLQVDNIYVIRHWYMHNKIQPTRIVKSMYRKQLDKLCVNEQRAYEFT